MLSKHIHTIYFDEAVKECKKWCNPQPMTLPFFSFLSTQTHRIHSNQNNMDTMKISATDVSTHKRLGQHIDPMHTPWKILILCLSHRPPSANVDRNNCGRHCADYCNHVVHTLPVGVRDKISLSYLHGLQLIYVVVHWCHDQFWITGILIRSFKKRTAFRK